MPLQSVAFVSADQGKLMLDLTRQTNLLDIRSVCRSFPKGSGEDLLVLEKSRPDDSFRRNCRPARAFRIGQVDAAAHHRRTYRAVLR